VAIVTCPSCGKKNRVPPAAEGVPRCGNVDDAPQSVARFEVRGIPTLVVMRGGQEVDRIAGAPSRPDLVSWIERHLAQPVG
jgi:hypothetical protein